MENLNINENMEELQKNQLVETSRKHSSAYAWEYTYIKGINPKNCMHHIYIEESVRPVRQPQSTLR